MADIHGQAVHLSHHGPNPANPVCHCRPLHSPCARRRTGPRSRLGCPSPNGRKAGGGGQAPFLSALLVCLNWSVKAGTHGARRREWTRHLCSRLEDREAAAGAVAGEAGGTALSPSQVGASCFSPEASAHPARQRGACGGENREMHTDAASRREQLRASAQGPLPQPGGGHS